jgi:hypothetical protein
MNSNSQKNSFSLKDPRPGHHLVTSSYRLENRDKLSIELVFEISGLGGGARRSRTADLLNAIQALSQLSYGPSRDQGSAARYQEIILPMPET